MFLPEIGLKFFASIYRLPPPPQHRTVELDVLCLGLPRSGTESLSRGLSILGYHSVSHGFVWWSTNPECSELYYRLGKLQAESNYATPSSTLRHQFLDRVLADHDATTDIPAAWFALELLDAYPNAKVVLNRRRDVKQWKESFRHSVLPMLNSWPYWWASWFDAELFWGMLLTYQMHSKILFRGDFEANAESAYLEHYKRIEERCRLRGIEWLDWSVEEGWEPLCAFLDRPVPETPFPHGNVAHEFEGKLMEADGRRFANAKRNASVFAALLGSAVVLSLSFFWSR